MTDNSNRIAGICYFNFDGVRVPLAGEFAYRLSGVNREPKLGQDGYHGYKEKPVTGQLSGKLRDTGGSLAKYADATNISAMAELSNGKTVTARNMFWSGDPPKADAEEAEIEFLLEGPDVKDA